MPTRAAAEPRQLASAPRRLPETAGEPTIRSLSAKSFSIEADAGRNGKDVYGMGVAAFLANDAVVQVFLVDVA